MDQSQLVRPPLEVFCSSAPNDGPLRKKLEKHLSLLQHEGIINTWHVVIALNLRTKILG